jgi:hypothetical protein
MSIPSTRIVCTGCDYEQPVHFEPIELRYELPDGRAHLGGRIRGWCCQCEAVTDIEPRFDVADVNDRLRHARGTLEVMRAGPLGALRRLAGSSRLAEAQAKVESLMVQLEVARGHEGRQHCLACGSENTKTVEFDDDGLSKFTHSCGRPLRFLAPESDAPRFHFGLRRIRLAPTGECLGEERD